MPYYLSPALAKLKSQVNAHFPKRDKASDGWIGDVAHGSRVSDHNPATDSTPKGMVRAIDVDEDLVPGGSTAGPANDLVAALITDPRTAYVIYEGRIWQNPAVFANGGWRKYSGVNAHAHHVHVSVRRGKAWDRDDSPWPMPGIAAVVRPDIGADFTPTPVQEDDMANVTDQQLDRMLRAADRVLGALPGPENGRQDHPRVLDTGDGAAIVQNLGFVRNQLAEFTRSVVNAAVATVPSVDQVKVEAAVSEAATRALANLELTFTPKG